MKRVLLLLVATMFLPLIGCGKNEQGKPQAGVDPATAVGDDDHHHGDPPHGGLIADWGGGAYHVEFTVDHDAQSATVYILGDDAHTQVPVRADKLLLTVNEPQFEVELVADPQSGEPEGSASQFTGTHEHLGIEREFAGTIVGEVDGTPYAADFDEAAGGHAH